MNQFKFNHNEIKAFSILGISVGMKWTNVQEKFLDIIRKTAKMKSDKYI